MEDQFPVVKIKKEFFTMSLRMMKAVWYRARACHVKKTRHTHALWRRRNVRLRKGFVNVEQAAFGGKKLKIPSLLYVEKMRTQNRFNVSRVCVVSFQLVLKPGVALAAYAYGRRNIAWV